MADRSELRKRQDKAVEEFIEGEVITCLDAHEAYSNRCDKWTKRFEALRSVQGLTYGDDPDTTPKLEPWEGSADVGLPLEAIILRSIIARFVKTIFTKPICTVAVRGNKPGLQTDSKTLGEYNEYTLEDEMGFERRFYDILMDVGLTGDGIGKLIEADEEYEWEEIYHTLIHPDTGEPVTDPNTANEFDAEEWPNGYPIEVPDDHQPEQDIVSGATPKVEQVTVTKKDKTYFGSKLIPVDPRDLVLPKDATDWDYDSLPFLGHKLKKTWHWLKAREGDVEDGGYDSEVIERLKPKNEEGGKVPTTFRIPLIEMWGKVDMPVATGGGDGKTKVREIIALYALETKELLGWIPNPYRGKRMFFHWQIMPMPHRARGKGIPEFAKGIRDLADSLFNNLSNRDTINAHPPFVYDEESGFDPDIHQFGPQEFWGVNDKTKLGRLDMGNSDEGRTEWAINFALTMLQRLFGVNDYDAQLNDKSKGNAGYRSIMAMIGEGNYSFDTMIALLQMTNKKFFEANIRMHAKMLREAGMQKKIFHVTGDSDNPFREIDAETLSLGWNFMPRGTSITNNQQYKQQQALGNLEVLSKTIFFDPNLSPTTLDNLRKVVQAYIDAADIKITLPDKGQLEQEQVQQKTKVAATLQRQQQLRQLQATAKYKKGTPQGKAAQAVLAKLAMSGQDLRQSPRQRSKKPQPGLKLRGTH